MTWQQTSMCWGGGCENEPMDESGLCDDCLDVLVDRVVRADWRFG